MALSFFKWSHTAASNATADPAINMAEGMAPSAVNDGIRALMASASGFRDDIAGAIVTAGTSTAYTVTSYQIFDTLANMNGMVIAFTPHTTNGATVTLNVDGLGAKALRQAPSTEILAGVLVAGTPYIATYYNATGEWILQSFYGNPYNIPLGAMLSYTGDTAPNSAFILPYGQALSRTTYATYFAVVSTRFGTGDGSTTFNAPDLRGRLIAGYDSMGGSAASRLTTAGGGIDGTTIGAVGGAQNRTISTTYLPASGLSVPALSVPGLSIPSLTTSAVSVPALSVPALSVPSLTVAGLSVPSLTVATTTGNVGIIPLSSGTVGSLQTSSSATANITPANNNGSWSGTTSLSGTGTTGTGTTGAGSTGTGSTGTGSTGTGTSGTGTTGTGTTGGGTSGTGTTGNMGSGTALQTLPPAMVLNYILRIL